MESDIWLPRAWQAKSKEMLNDSSLSPSLVTWGRDAAWFWWTSGRHHHHLIKLTSSHLKSGALWWQFEVGSLRAKWGILLPFQGSIWYFKIFCAGPCQTIWEGNKKPQRQKFTTQEQSVPRHPGLEYEPDLHIMGEYLDSCSQRHCALSLLWWGSFLSDKWWNNHWNKDLTLGFPQATWEPDLQGWFCSKLVNIHCLSKQDWFQSGRLRKVGQENAYPMLVSIFMHGQDKHNAKLKGDEMRLHLLSVVHTQMQLIQGFSLAHGTQISIRQSTAFQFYNECSVCIVHSMEVCHYRCVLHLMLTAMKANACPPSPFPTLFFFPLSYCLQYWFQVAEGNIPVGFLNAYTVV